MKLSPWVDANWKAAGVKVTLTWERFLRLFGRPSRRSPRSRPTAPPRSRPSRGERRDIVERQAWRGWLK